jgi:hypothetical protein
MMELVDMLGLSSGDHNVRGGFESLYPYKLDLENL